MPVVQVTGKGIVGFAPSLPHKQAEGNSLELLKEVKRRLYQVYLGKLLASVRTFADRGMLLYANGDIIRFYPVFSVFVNDNEEGAAVCGVFGGSGTQRPCRTCLTPRQDLHDFVRFAAFRIQQHMEQKVREWRLALGVGVGALTAAQAKEESAFYSLHPDLVSTTSIKHTIQRLDR
jgi:hypothetical protein